MTRIWSHYQEGVFEFVANGSGHGLVEAKPGSGKTTVIEEAVRRVPITETVLAVAFNRHIRDELKRRLEHLVNVQVHTLNSFGNSVCRKYLGWYKVNEWKIRNVLKFDILKLTKNTWTKENNRLFWQTQGAILKLVPLAKAHMVFTADDLLASYMDLAERYDVDIPTDPDLNFENYLLQTFLLEQGKGKVIDYDDQIAMPLRKGWPIPTFNRVFVDESQDLTPAQIELTSRALQGGRALYVGDRRQAIYQFRGADSKAMENIHMMMDCTPLPLSICYRCSKAVVREAQKIDPELEAWDQAPEGSVSTVATREFRLKADAGDVVLCRTTAPVVQECLRFIREGKKAVVKGREIGQNLVELVLNLANGNFNMATVDLLDTLMIYYDLETEKNTRAGKEDKQILLDDKVETIKAVAESCKTVGAVKKKFEAIFGDEDRAGITLMTIHKAKGLEAPRVFILRPDQLPHKLAKTEEALQAEENLKFVAITRAEVDLFWVDPSDTGAASASVPEELRESIA